jgi:hypothetical protein
MFAFFGFETTAHRKPSPSPRNLYLFLKPKKKMPAYSYLSIIPNELLQIIISELNGHDLALLSQTCKELYPRVWQLTKKLDLDSFSKLTKIELRKIMSKSPLLYEISLPITITDDHLFQLKSFPQLRTLKLESCQQVTNDGLQAVSNIVSIETLLLISCRKITDNGLSHLSRLDHLQILDLSWCTKITDVGLMHLSQLSNIRSLILKGCDKISDQGVCYLSYQLLSLRSLDLGLCESLTDNALAYVSSFPQLQFLNLWGLSEITDNGLEHLASNSIKKNYHIHIFFYLSHFSASKQLFDCKSHLFNQLFFSGPTIVLFV